MMRNEQPTKMRSRRFCEPLKRTLALGLASVLVSSYSLAQMSVPAKTDVALVTFFSYSFSLTGGLPEQKPQAFKGRLFVDDDQLALISGSQFFTMEFLPGHYQFSANTWMTDSPMGGAHLDMDLSAGHHYFIEARTRQSWPVSKAFGIREVSCAEATRDGTSFQRVEAKNLKQAALPNVVQEATFPACDAIMPPTAAATPHSAPDALVTFYNQGSQFAPLAPVAKDGIFAGWVWDGKTLLIAFQESKWQIHGNRFITFHLPAGEHEFSVSYQNYAPKKGHVDTVLEAGKHYYFRTRVESWNALVVSDFRPKLDTVTCKEAITEARNAQSLKPRVSPPDLATLRADNASFPDNCDDAANVVPTFPDQDAQTL
jgi:hypothetical protein